MIRFKDTIYNDYFIDKETAIITRSDGTVVETRFHNPYIVIKGEGELAGAAIHVIQANTWLGYEKDKEVHHIDKNKFNNALSNLCYLTKSEHQALHRHEDGNIGLGNQKGENNNMYDVKYKWINNGEVCKFLLEGEVLPNGWTYGRIFRKEAIDNIKNANTGRHHTTEAKEKMSLSRKGKKFSDEHRLHMTKKWKLEHKETINEQGE